MDPNMTPERFQQIRNLFDAALERDASACSAFLEEACHGDDELRLEVERLLHARDKDTGWLDADASAAAGRLEGWRIGAYQILRRLGEGGMGTVYLAARVDGAFHKLVALKIVRPETATAEVLRRFRQEREILASLEHLNIARVLDGGETPDGLPYLVMEYIDGKPIDVYCDEHHLRVSERVALFEQVCSAVRYAHSKQVVHRDLKPSNVLVTHDGDVKLLDFGIAKLLATNDAATLLRTRSDLLLMTPEYASPEQVRGESVTASSDIYSLGVLLYELLTGRCPYRLRSRIFHEITRIICEEEPTWPSAAVTQRDETEKDLDRAPEALSRKRGVSPEDLHCELTGNLDGILLKALEKDPLQRHTSVAELIEELDKHLRGESVRARRNAGLYTLRTFGRRNSSWITAGVVLALAVWNGWISQEATFLVVLLLLALSIGLLIFRREWGGGFPPAPLLNRGVKFLGLILLLTLSAISLTLKLHLDLFSVWSVPVTMILAWGCYFLLRWPWREKLLGPLLLDASWPRNRAYLAVLLLGIVVSVVALGASIDELRDQHPAQFVYFHITNRPQPANQDSYGIKPLSFAADRVLFGRHDVFSSVTAFAPLFTPSLGNSRSHSQAASTGVPIQFGSRFGNAFGEQVSTTFFSNLNISRFYLGRSFTPAAGTRAVVLSYDWWKRQFASQPSVIGQTLYVKEVPFSVIGVAPSGFSGIDPVYPTDFWIPLQSYRSFNPGRTNPAGASPNSELLVYSPPDWCCLLMLARLRPGITPSKLSATLALALHQAIPAFDPLESDLYFSPANSVQDWGEHQQREQALEWARWPFMQLLIGAFLFANWWLYRRVEIREQGIAAAGNILRWSRLAGYSWEQKFGELEVLRFRLTGPWKWLSLRGIAIKRDLRPQLDQLLQQQFMEWPRRASQ